MNPFFTLMGDGAGESPAFSIGTALESASTIMTWVVTQVQNNAVIAAAFTMGILVPVGVKAFKKIAKTGK